MEKAHENILDRTGRTIKIAERLAKVEPYLVPLTDNDADTQLMAAYDLASCITTRIGVNIDPDTLRDSNVYDHWLDLASNEWEHFGDYFHSSQRFYWIAQHGERIGTIGYAVRDYGHEVTLHLTSVYVRPEHRRQEWASRMLNRIKDVAFEIGVDRIFVSCEWGNQNALRFYLAQGMWVHGWKHAIRLIINKGESPLRKVVEGSRATFFVGDRAVGVADNHGDRLRWQLGDAVDRDLTWQLEATAPLVLALLDWPIVRNDEEGQNLMRWRPSDFGNFEDLAVRIRHFERHLRNRGWIVPAPNPSFATLPKIVAVHPHADRFDVRVDDGTTYPLLYEMLDPMPTTENPVTDVFVVASDEVRYTLSSGEEGCEVIDHILWINQSPQHFDNWLDFRRNDRRMRAAATDAAISGQREADERSVD